ncbi:MAG: glycosyltransferase [Flavobacteriales bacterium]
MKKLLLIGTKPPPLGGVTVFVERLYNHLEIRNDINFKFIDYKRVNTKTLIKEIFNSNVVHLNGSNPFFRLFVVSISKILFKKVLNTIHGDLGRFNTTQNLADYIAMFLSTMPLVLNDKSLVKALKINKKSIKISSFIPPLSDMKDDKIEEIMDDYGFDDFIFCTNASKVSFDRLGNEIYGITYLIKIFKTLPAKYKLIISTPSEEYLKYLEANKIEIPENIKIVSFNHNFVNVIKKSDVMIRATSTDGDAISIKEALYFGKEVFCTNVVSRPERVKLFGYGDQVKLKKMILSYEKKEKQKFQVENSLQELIKLYKTI